MPYQTFADQVASHLNFFQDNGLLVSSIEINNDFIRANAIGEVESGRGEYVYKTQKNKLNKPGVVGLVSWCRGPKGIMVSHKTYGLDGGLVSYIAEMPTIRRQVSPIYDESVSSKCRYLWDQAKPIGQSDYLQRKKVGPYGIRFQERPNYGRVALIPARDLNNTLHAIELLNSDGSKRLLKRLGLFHKLNELTNGQPFGLAESYVTAATCLELSGIPMVCAFSAGNLPLGPNLCVKSIKIVEFSSSPTTTDTLKLKEYPIKAF